MTRGKTKRLAWETPYKKSNAIYNVAPTQSIIYKEVYEKIFKKRKPKHANSR
jgi:hypothetical protein